MHFKKLATLVAAAALTCFSFSTAFADYAVGDRGQEVIEIQKQLAVLHYNVGTVDGVFGPATEKAVKDFQTAKGLKADGIVNEDTYRNLLNKELPPDRYGNHMMTRNILKTAYSMLGVPYMFGGISPGGFDCSGFVQYVYKSFGYSLNRTAAGQNSNGIWVSRDNLKAGDIVLFNTSGGISHAGIYVGNDTFIHAVKPGTPLQYDKLSSSYYSSRYVSARRIIY